MLKIRENLGLVYFVLPYLNPVKNKLGLLLSILLGSSKYKIKIKNNQIINFDSSQFTVMQGLLGLLTYSADYAIHSTKEISVSLDLKKYFTIPLERLSYEDENFIQLLFLGTKYGADFINDDRIQVDSFRDKTFRISEINGKRTIETSTGIKFYIDSIHVGNTIIETFVKNIHLINSDYDWTDRIVVDVGAECGDTPLYFASKGAKVYAFEPVKSHHEAMIRNIGMNPHLAERIIAINAAIGKDGILKFFESPNLGGGGGASFLYNNQGKNAKISEVIGYSLETALVKFGIGHVDLLKMDCKGCEFFLNETVLENIDMIKIEYSIHSNEHKIENLLKILENAGFQYSIYRNSEQSRRPNRLSANIYGIKNKSASQTRNSKSTIKKDDM